VRVLVGFFGGLWGCWGVGLILFVFLFIIFFFACSFVCLFVCMVVYMFVHQHSWHFVWFACLPGRNVQRLARCGIN
jgi:hypothetical protein